MQFHIYTQELEEHTASWFELGTALHYTIEQAIEEDLSLRRTITRAKNNVNERIEEYENLKPMLWSPNRPKAEVEVLAERLITTWYETWMGAKRPLANLAWPPQLEQLIVVAPEDMPEHIKAGLRTTADALFTCRTCRGKVIVDWKTGRTRRSDPVQLQVYRWGLERMGMNICTCDRGWGFFYHLEHDRLQRVDEYDPELVVTMIADSQALKLTPPKATASWKCDWCLGKSVCPIWQLEKEDREAQQTLIEWGARRYQWQADPTI